MQLKLYWLQLVFCTVTLTANTISMVTLIREMRSDELYIPGFSTDIFVSTSSTMQLLHNHFCL